MVKRKKAKAVKKKSRVRKKPRSSIKSTKSDKSLKKILRLLERRPQKQRVPRDKPVIREIGRPGIRRSRFETPEEFRERRVTGRRFIRGRTKKSGKSRTSGSERFTRTQQGPARFGSIFNGIKAPGTFTPSGIINGGRQK